MASIREAVRRQFGTARPPSIEVDPGSIVRFSPHLPDELDDEEREQLSSQADELGPWLQGPFHLGGDLVVGGAWRKDRQWAELGAEFPGALAGQRVADIGCNAGYDAFMFSLRGAEYVLACEPYEFIEQARFLESIYETGTDFQRIGWQELDPERHGQFDLVHCNGLLYHERNPLELLEALRRITAPGGLLLLGSMMLADPALSDHVRFVPTDYYGDPTWWWVPGRLALRWMVETSGFDVERVLPEQPGLPGEFRTVNGYLQAIRVERSPAGP
jgi:tRNA (mo5U34)-methyltransferase